MPRLPVPFAAWCPLRTTATAMPSSLNERERTTSPLVTDLSLAAALEAADRDVLTRPRSPVPGPRTRLSTTQHLRSAKVAHRFTGARARRGCPGLAAAAFLQATWRGCVVL